MSLSTPQFAGCVLLVEDNPVNVLVAKTMLTDLGPVVDVAADGDEALEKLEKGNYDLVFMDCQMPRMDGYAATRAWRARELAEGRSRTPIVALTANTLPGDRHRSLDAGMDDHVSKPYHSNDLIEMLRRFLPST